MVAHGKNSEARIAGLRIQTSEFRIKEMAFWKRLRLTLEMIKFEHSVFALPFALTGALLAFRESHFDARGFGYKLLWIAMAVVSARRAHLAFNAILVADID